MLRALKKALESDDAWSVEDMEAELNDGRGFGLDEVRRCAEALENRLAGADGEVVTAVLEEVLPRLEELANQQRSLSKSLAYSRHTTQELKQLRSQQHDLGKGLATVARALTHLIDPPDVRATRAPQSGRQSSARVDTLVKALGPHAPRMGHMVRQWFGSGGGFQKSFDKELAAKMLAAGQLSAAEMVRWKKYNRLPDHCRASA